jgi:hypothetical protein
MAAYRDKAKELLDKLPTEVRSDLNKAEFTRLTNGMTHAELQRQWEATKNTTTLRTVCIDFVGWYAQQMGINILKDIPAANKNPKEDGFFGLEATLKKSGKGHAWVSAASGARPQYGDILRHTAFHVDVARGFENKVLLRIAGGQSFHKRPTNDVSKEYDNIIKVRGKADYQSSALQGWLDIEKYFESPPASLPTWVVGWWKVLWRGGTYYYYLAADRSARWTQTTPTAYTPPPLVSSAPRTGSFAFTYPDKVKITWTDSGNVEAYTTQQFTPKNEAGLVMVGTWQQWEPIVATKL